MKYVIKILTAMMIWGSIGIFVRYIPLPSIEIAFFRAIIASIFLFGVKIFTKKSKPIPFSLKDFYMLIISGIIISINWLLLFQSYKYTTISNATLSYYTAPIFVILLSPIILKEKITLKKIMSVFVALVGLILIISQNPSSSGALYNHPLGVFYGLTAAVLYAFVILLNKRINNFSGIDRTFVQILVSAIFLLPLVLYRNQIHIGSINILIIILVLGVFHTGIAYLLYFSSIEHVSAQKASILSYIDPISAVMFGTIFLKEGLVPLQILGGILILLSTLVNIKD